MAACILLALGLAGILVWSNPTTRAWVERYLFLRFEDRDEYWFRGNGTMQDPGEIRPAYVPEGFVLMSEEMLGKNQFFIYENDEGKETAYDKASAYYRVHQTAVVDGSKITSSTTDYTDITYLADEATEEYSPDKNSYQSNALFEAAYKAYLASK